MASLTVQSLQQRISQMQPARMPERSLPTHPGLRPLLPGGAIKAGAAYTVHGSWQLALAFLTEASASGAWCGVIGCPSFGAESAAALGVALDRCILIPQPGPDAHALAGALSEVLTITLLHTATPTTTGSVERIAARLREHGSALIVTGAWPGAAATLDVTGSRWEGIERGFGRLHTRALTVTASSNRGPSKRHTLRFTAGALSPSEPT
ncbi:hypothetical protein ACXR2W_10180 [Leucobacter sp. HY1908]